MEQDLEKKYNPSNYSKRFSDPDEILAKFYEFIGSKSKELEASGEVSIEKNLRYGQGEATLLNIYKSLIHPSDDKLFVYIHGGYWQEGNKDSYGFFKPLIEKGFVVIVPGFDLAPRVSVKEIMEQMKQLFKYLQKYTSANDIKETWVCGHCAGTQQALSLLLEQQSESNKDFITGFILVSGVYNLEPLIPTSNNVPLRLVLEEAIEASPMNWNQEEFLQAIKNLSFLLVVGQEESPAFLKQTTDMAKWLQNKDAKNVKLQCLPEYDHFNIIEELYDENSVITTCILQFLQAASS